MKTASLRHMQHHLSEVIRWVDHGEEVLITRRNRVVAKLVPATPASPKKMKWPDFLKRAQHIKVKGKPLSQTIVEDREERF